MNLSERIATGDIERVPPNMGAAGTHINEARTNIASTDLLADSNTPLALIAAYDAARKAATAILVARGLRVKAVPGAHRITFAAAAELLDAVTDDDITALDRLRQSRHTAEYGDFASQRIRRGDVEHASELATRFVNTCAAHLASS